MPRSQSLIRALSVLRTLDGRRRWTLAELAARYAVTERTIRRDLAALEAAGVPVCHEQVGPGKALRGTWWVC
jgi:predicted DNA-binding transcriptional regulator YafY